MEIIVADGMCQKSHTCTTNRQEPSKALMHAMNKDARVRYHDNVPSASLGEKRNWLLRHASDIPCNVRREGG